MSSQRDRLYDSMVFNYRSSYLNDYRDGEILPLVKTEYQGKAKKRGGHSQRLKYMQTMAEFKHPIPFNLMMKPKEILHRNPRDIQKAFEAPPDVEREEVQKTRPRLVMTPAVSLDDIPEPGRQVLIDDMYTTTVMKQLQESAAAFPENSVRAPFGKRPAPSLPLKLPRVKVPYVSPEWRMDSVTWDNNQLRAYCDPTKWFWQAKDKSMCSVCDSTEARVAQNRRLRSMKK